VTKRQGALHVRVREIRLSFETDINGQHTHWQINLQINHALSCLFLVMICASTTYDLYRPNSGSFQLLVPN
jgi:hypothetical protein